MDVERENADEQEEEAPEELLVLPGQTDLRDWMVFKNGVLEFASRRVEDFTADEDRGSDGLRMGWTGDGREDPDGQQHARWCPERQEPEEPEEPEASLEEADEEAAFGMGLDLTLNPPETAPPAETLGTAETPGAAETPQRPRRRSATALPEEAEVSPEKRRRVALEVLEQVVDKLTVEKLSTSLEPDAPETTPLGCRIVFGLCGGYYLLYLLDHHLFVGLNVVCRPRDVLFGWQLQRLLQASFAHSSFLGLLLALLVSWRRFAWLENRAGTVAFLGWFVMSSLILHSTYCMVAFLSQPFLGQWLMDSEVHGLYPVLVANLVSSLKDTDSSSVWLWPLPFHVSTKHFPLVVMTLSWLLHMDSHLDVSVSYFTAVLVPELFQEPVAAAKKRNTKAKAKGPKAKVKPRGDDEMEDRSQMRIFKEQKGLGRGEGRSLRRPERLRCEVRNGGWHITWQRLAGHEGSVLRYELRAQVAGGIALATLAELDPSEPGGFEVSLHQLPARVKSSLQSNGWLSVRVAAVGGRLGAAPRSATTNSAVLSEETTLWLRELTEAKACEIKELFD
eukprot:g1598.t1